MHKDVQIYIWKVEALTMKGLSCPIPIRGEDKMHPSYAVYFPTACMWNFLHLFLKLQFLSLIEFVIVWFSFSTFFFSLILPKFFEIAFLICWWKITGKILQGLASPSLATKCNIFHELLAFKGICSVWSIVPVLRGFLQRKDKNRICKILNIKPMIWEFPISKAQK